MQNPKIEFYKPGSYSVSFIASNEDNFDAKTKTDYIKVFSKVIALYLVNDTIVKQGDNVKFNDKSQGDPTNWEWHFEGGAPLTSTEQNPSIQYSEPGAYKVNLIASNELSTDSIIGKIMVLANVNASYTVSDTIILEGEKITYTDESQGEPTNWIWEFDGGSPSSSEEQHPIIEYKEPGLYKVNLTVSNLLSSDLASSQIQVLPKVVAGYTVSDSIIEQGTLITFTDKSLGDPINWSWEFEGGSPSSSAEQNPKITYSAPGIYDVRLTASNLLSTNIITGQITVLPKVIASFTVSDSIIYIGDQIILNDKSQGNPTSWLWDFKGGDPSTSSEQNPTVTFNYPRSYNIKLTSSNLASSDTTSSQIRVLSNVIASYIASDTIINQGSQITFTDKSQESPNKWYWEFEGGSPSTSTEQNPTILYNEPGVYYVSLTSYNLFSSNTVTGQIIVMPANNLIVQYPFNGNANDFSGNSNHGIISGATLTSDRNGVSRSAYKFDGVNDKISFAYHTKFDNAPLTFSFWVNFSDFNSVILGNDIIDNDYPYLYLNSFL